MGNITDPPAAPIATEPKRDESPAGLPPRTRLQRLRRSAITLGIAYSLAVIVLSCCANKLILFPTTEPIPGVNGQRLEVPGPAGAVEVWKSRSPGAPNREPVAFVMVFVGNASRAEYDLDPMARSWGKRPVEVWAVNYPGFGGSAGGAKLSLIAPAALAAFDAMKKQAGNRPTFIAGRSIGTTAALYVAAHRPVNGVILHSPPPLRSLIIGKFGWWNLWLAAIPVALNVPSELDSLENAANVKVPGVFLISGADTLVTPPYQQKVVDAYAGPKQVILMPDADHNDPLEETALRSLHLSMDWLLAQAGASPAVQLKGGESNLPPTMQASP